MKTDTFRGSAHRRRPVIAGAFSLGIIAGKTHRKHAKISMSACNLQAKPRL